MQFCKASRTQAAIDTGLGIYEEASFLGISLPSMSGPNFRFHLRNLPGLTNQYIQR